MDPCAGPRVLLRYCVAPILDPSSTTRVEFWAVGMDCCAERGDFQCGDATAEGTAAAHVRRKTRRPGRTQRLGYGALWCPAPHGVLFLSIAWHCIGINERG